MKFAAFAVVLLLSLHGGGALKCNFCQSQGWSLCTNITIQTCSPPQDTCGAVVLKGPPNHSFRQCMNNTVCEGFIRTPAVFASCCHIDLCN